MNGYEILNKNNVMVDIETMGTGSSSALIAIGAVKFNHNITDKFSVIIDLQSSIDSGLTVDGSTILWWLKQSEEARKPYFNEGVKLSIALGMFGEWIGDNAIMWGNGAMFDNAILTNAYKIAGFGSPPWDFWNDMCYRTVKNLNQHIPLDRVGIHHNAVDDAHSQALHLIKILTA